MFRSYTDGRVTLYRDGYGVPMLELFSERAPVGGYREGITDDEWNFSMADAGRRFGEEYGVEIYFLGRSGRHICIEDTPRNRRRYRTLCKRAAEYARDFWESMRSPVEA